MDSTNSLIELKENKISLINRQDIKSVQTPQCFKRNLILNVLKSSIEGTDEMGMLLKFDYSKKIQQNLVKITD